MHQQTKSGILSKHFITPVFFLGLLFAATSSRAAIVGPYTPDSATLHLWHLNEGAAPIVDFAITGGTNLTALNNGATLSNSSFSGVFGTALSTIDGGQAGTNLATAIDAYLAPRALANSTADDTTLVYADPATGAFTFEALVRISFDPKLNMGPATFVNNGVAGNGRNTPMQIVSGENDAGTRAWQFRLDPIGFNPGAASAGVATNIIQPAIEFIRVLPVTQSLIAFLPTNGPNAIVSNQWYHVAVTYNGNDNTPDNFKVYWSLLDDTYTQAVELFSGKMTNDLSVGPIDFCIGNIGRNPPNGNFIGLIDEVRISKVARAANEMLFSVPQVVIVEQPVGQTNAIGLPVSFRVAASGQAPLIFQWQHEGTNLPGATQYFYSIAAAQPSDGGDYSVIISNGVNSVTSSIVRLTLRTAINLTWIGSGGTNWDTSTINWDSDANGTADAPFNQGDTVLFNNQGNATSPINLTGIFFPGTFSVNADINYTLTSSSGGGISGFTGLNKSGNGTLVMDTDNTYSGPTTIQTGTLQVGTGAARATLGTGSLTNNSVLLINRSGALTFNSFFAGNGSLTNNGTNTVTIAGTNTFSGPITLNAGALTLANAQAIGPSTEYTLHAAGNATTLTVGGGVTFGPGTTISLLDTTASPDNRCSLNTSSDTNTFNCNILLGGDGSIQFVSGGAASNSLFQVTTPSINSPAYTGQLILRGAANGVVTSQMNLGGKVSKTDAGIWTITSTGNSWIASDVAGGTLRMGANGAFPSTVSVNITAAAAVLDLAGTIQSIGALAGPGIIASSSTTLDSRISVNPPTFVLFSGTIQDAVNGGTRRVGLTVAGGELDLSGTNTYTGSTIVSGGTLVLFVGGIIPNTSVIDISAGATVDASLRSDQTLTLNPAQTLKGNGAFNVLGKLVNNGTIELKVNKAGVALSNDSINGLNTITYGGTLKLNITASPALTTSDSFKLFNASGYSGSFANFVPSIPAAGLAWDASTLASDGTIRIMTSTVNTTPTNIVASVSGNQLTLSWPADHTGWRLQSQTNAVTVGITTNWFDVSGSTMTNQTVFTLNPTNGTVFFRLIYP